MAPDTLVSIEVVYARAAEQAVVALALPAGSTVADAIERSGLLTRFPEIADGSKVGIFGRLVARDTVLVAGDRVELYRPLIADPKQARRRRAAAAKL